MSKVKLIVVTGNGSDYAPYIGGSDRIIDTKIELPESDNIVAIERYDFESDKNGDTRAGSDLCPVIPYEHVNNLVGKILTLIDATFSDKEQRKAMKDLFTQIPWDWYNGHLDAPRTTWRKDKGYEK